MNKSVVSSVPINKHYPKALETLLHPFPEVKNRIAHTESIFIKICIDHHNSNQYTNLNLLQAVLKWIRKTNASAPLYLIDNHVYGNFSRLLARMLDIHNIVKPYKAKLIFLDEKKSAPITIGGAHDPYKILFPQWLSDQLLTNRDKHVYFNLANLKTHFSTKVAAGIFNQIGFINRLSYWFVHSPHLSRTLVDLLRLIQPDFSIIDANAVFKHGFLPPANLLNQYTISIDRLIGGADTVAVDSVGCELLGYRFTEIEHLKLAVDQQLGIGKMDQIDVRGDLGSYHGKIEYSFELSQLPIKMDIIFGNNYSDIDYCVGLSLLYAQIIYKDFLANGGFSLLAGNDFSDLQLQNLREPIIVLGNQTCTEVASFLYSHYHDVYCIDQCEHIEQIMAVLAKAMGASKFNLLGTDPFTVWRHYLIGKIKGSDYQLPFISRSTKYWKPPKQKKKQKK